jgi:hypothetical protein
MVEATGLKLLYWGHFQWQDLSAEVRENLPVGRKISSEGHADGPTGDLISLPSIFLRKVG